MLCIIMLIVAILIIIMLSVSAPQITAIFTHNFNISFQSFAQELVFFLTLFIKGLLFANFLFRMKKSERERGRGKGGREGGKRL